MSCQMGKRYSVARTIVLTLMVWCVQWVDMRVSAQEVLPCGQEMAQHRGVAAQSNGRDMHTGNSCDSRGEFGNRYQCVEYVKRFYAHVFGVADAADWRGNGGDYYRKAEGFGLVRFENGGANGPQVDDIMVFAGGAHGHVAVVTRVTSDHVEIVEQNWSTTGRATLRVVTTGGSVTVSPRGGYRISGWLRHPSRVLRPTPTNQPPVAAFTASASSGASSAGGTLTLVADAGTGQALVTFTDQSQDPDGHIVWREWRTGSGVLLSENDTTFAWGFMPGSYVVVLRVRDDRGGEAVATVAVDVTASQSQVAARFSVTDGDGLWSSGEQGAEIVVRSHSGEAVLVVEDLSEHPPGLAVTRRWTTLTGESIYVGDAESFTWRASSGVHVLRLTLFAAGGEVGQTELEIRIVRKPPVTYAYASRSAADVVLWFGEGELEIVVNGLTRRRAAMGWDETVSLEQWLVPGVNKVAMKVRNGGHFWAAAYSVMVDGKLVHRRLCANGGETCGAPRHAQGLVFEEQFVIARTSNEDVREVYRARPNALVDGLTVSPDDVPVITETSYEWDEAMAGYSPTGVEVVKLSDEGWRWRVPLFRQDGTIAFYRPFWLDSGAAFRVTSGPLGRTYFVHHSGIFGLDADGAEVPGWPVVTYRASSAWAYNARWPYVMPVLQDGTLVSTLVDGGRLKSVVALRQDGSVSQEWNIGSETRGHMVALAEGSKVFVGRGGVEGEAALTVWNTQTGDTVCSVSGNFRLSGLVEGGEGGIAVSEGAWDTVAFVSSDCSVVRVQDQSDVGSVEAARGRLAVTMLHRELPGRLAGGTMHLSGVDADRGVRWILHVPWMSSPILVEGRVYFVSGGYGERQLWVVDAESGIPLRSAWLGSEDIPSFVVGSAGIVYAVVVDSVAGGFFGDEGVPIGGHRVVRVW